MAQANAFDVFCSMRAAHDECTVDMGVMVGIL